MMSGESPPLPNVTAEDSPFWEAARDEEFRMQQCTECERIRWPPGPVCPDCWAEDHEWAELSGRGAVNSWVVYHQEYHPAFADAIPYNVAEIELEEGPRYLAPVVDCENDDLYRGMPVAVVFEPVSEEITLPKFAPR